MRRVQPYLPSSVRVPRQIESTFVGTMGGTMMTSPVRRRYPAKAPRLVPVLPCPQPWAWYRGDDILESVEGAEVRDWPDRAGSRNLNDSYSGTGATGYPEYTLNAVGGHPGVKRTAFSNSDLAAEYAGIEFAELSMLLVGHSPGGTDRFSAYMAPTDPAGTQVTVTCTSTWVEAFMGDGGYAAGPVAVGTMAVLVVQRLNDMRIWVNGSPLALDSHTAPAGNNTSIRHLQELDTGTRWAEWKIWLEALSDDCIAEENAYINTRYGL